MVTIIICKFLIGENEEMLGQEWLFLVGCR